VNIIINHRTISVDKQVVAYEEVVKLAGQLGYPTVVYCGPRHGDVRREGLMYPGCRPVELESNMRFTVIHTDNA